MINDILDLKLVRDMKYEALYWALGFLEETKGVFTKQYSYFQIEINVENGIVNFKNRIAVIGSEYFVLNSHKSFVILECVDKLLSIGYFPHEIIIDLDNEYDIYTKNLYIKCCEWNKSIKDYMCPKKDTYLSITYESRLVGGVIERKTSIRDHTNQTYDFGVFDLQEKSKKYSPYQKEDIVSDDFIIKNNVVFKYLGLSKKVYIPEGVTALSSSLFWDNQMIEEVVIPDSLTNLGGDTFYNCTNLKKVNIPSSVRYMGNNPFAGCPNLSISNSSEHFTLEDGVLYTSDFSRLIYYPINKQEKKYVVNSRTKIIGKHAFYLCKNLSQITIPSSVIKFENNPFSGCNELDLINHSLRYVICDKVIYSSDFTSVVGCLNSINTEELRLCDVKIIARNAFWNCKGIRRIILPSTLETIGYNPFVGCDNIEFINQSPNFVVENNILYSFDKSVLICCPLKTARSRFVVTESVNKIERGAFSGCSHLQEISFRNVAVIGKGAFTNCTNLECVYGSDLVAYIGEWAFAHCDNLKAISIYKDCVIDNFATLNSKATIMRREERTNYLIKSENMYTLKGMQLAYKGRIKSILIDPPYNSNIAGIGYQDGEFKEGYNEFLSQRIALAKNLLTLDGFLIINIDKNGLSSIKHICNKMFKNYYTIHKWEKIHPYFDKNRNVDRFKKRVRYEYIIICRNSDKAVFNTIMQPFFMRDELMEKSSHLPKVFRLMGTTASAKDELMDIFGVRDRFSTPKPLKLMKELIRLTTQRDSLVLDFFAGSGTVGHATMKLNEEDNGKRKFILITNNESNIFDNVTVPRIESIKTEAVVILSSK